jgi:FkbM family methyltransferase
VSLQDKLKLVRKTLAFHLDKRNGQQPRMFEVCVHVGDLRPSLRMRDSGGDVFIFHEVLSEQVYHVKSEWVKSEPKTIIDLGANIGLASLSLAAQFPGARVIAVEPHPETAALLRHNLACLGNRASVWEAAVSDRPGMMRLSLANENYNASLVRESEHGVDVRVVTMADVIAAEKLERIDVLKIDIEGAERMLLAGSPDWLRRVDLLLIEMHDGYGFPELERDVTPAGLTVYREGGAQGMAKREGAAAR